MQKQEFEQRINAEISAEDYSVVEYVYTWHPSIPDLFGKDRIAEIYKFGGMGLIRSMVESAKIAENYTRNIDQLRSRRDSLRNELARVEKDIADLQEKLEYYK